MAHLEIGSAPAEEQCQQVGTENYASNAKKECRIYREYLERLFPIPQHLKKSVSFYTKACPHDLGTYYEVAIEFDSEVEAALKFAYKVERNSPSEWDEIARKELHSLGLLA
ncbi:MAG: hypothetical protein V7K47_06925 [Nostoc sp.]